MNEGILDLRSAIWRSETEGRQAPMIAVSSQASWCGGLTVGLRSEPPSMTASLSG